MRVSSRCGRRQWDRRTPGFQYRFHLVHNDSVPRPFPSIDALESYSCVLGSCPGTVQRRKLSLTRSDFRQVAKTFASTLQSSTPFVSSPSLHNPNKLCQNDLRRVYTEAIRLCGRQLAGYMAGGLSFFSEILIIRISDITISE